MKVTKEFEGTAWETVEFSSKWESLHVDSKGSDGHVEISMSEAGHDTLGITLNQENLKLLIAHLQKQVI